MRALETNVTDAELSCIMRNPVRDLWQFVDQVNATHLNSIAVLGVRELSDCNLLRLSELQSVL